MPDTKTTKGLHYASASAEHLKKKSWLPTVLYNILSASALSAIQECHSVADGDRDKQMIFNWSDGIVLPAGTVKLKVPRGEPWYIYSFLAQQNKWQTNNKKATPISSPLKYYPGKCFSYIFLERSAISFQVQWKSSCFPIFRYTQWPFSPGPACKRLWLPNGPFFAFCHASCISGPIAFSILLYGMHSYQLSRYIDFQRSV
jgi:hypothetical protein